MRVSRLLALGLLIGLFAICAPAIATSPTGIGASYQGPLAGPGLVLLEAPVGSPFVIVDHAGIVLADGVAAGGIQQVPVVLAGAGSQGELVEIFVGSDLVALSTGDPDYFWD